MALIASQGFGTEKEVTEALRRRAEEELGRVREQIKNAVEIETLICEGVPFLEIIRKAEEFQVGAIVMGKYGLRGQLEKLLFGTTAERVLRTASRPVIVLPVNTTG